MKKSYAISIYVLFQLSTLVLELLYRYNEPKTQQLFVPVECNVQ
jgi:hypothetical protein